MKKIVVTNNKKVDEMFSGKVDVIFLENSTGLSVLEEAKGVASEGGRLLFDPTRYKGYYRSLPFFKENGGNEPEGKSISLIEKCIEEATKQGSGTEKEPILAGIYQKKDLDVVKKILS